MKTKKEGSTYPDKKQVATSPVLTNKVTHGGMFAMQSGYVKSINFPVFPSQNYPSGK